MSSQFKVFLTALVAIAVAAGGYFYLQGAKKDTDTIVLGAAISLTGKYSTNG
ncbi:MAG: amino acid ABC transporter substrate-binding protein, partial [Rhodospirillales bacterium]|nr:amino acid ABC transporter substrate-binding protein [Rhodospirillales bacterium]